MPAATEEAPEMARPEKLRQSLPMLQRLLERFAPELRKQRGVISGSFLAIFAEVGFRLLEPWPLGLIVDSVLQVEAEPGVHATGPFSSLDPSTLLWLAPLMLVAVVAARGLTAYVSAVGFALAGNRLVTAVRLALYTRLQALSVAFHRSSRSGDLIVRVVGDVGMVREVIVTALLPLIGNVMVLIGMVVVMGLMNWKLALVAFCTAPLFWLSNVRLGRRIRVVSKKQRRREGSLANQAAEMLGAVQVVQALSLEDELAAGFAAQNKGSLREGVQAKRLSARLERTVDVITGISTALVLFVGAQIVLSGELSPGELVIFLSYLKSSFRPVRNFAKYTARISKASAAAERVLEVLDEEPDITEKPGARPAPAFEGAIRFENADFLYDERSPVLSDINFQVAPGEHVAIVGESGVGKSTLLAAIPRLHDPAGGRVLIDGEDIQDFTLDSLRGQVVVLLQESVLFAGTVRENIGLGAPNSSNEDIERVAALANAHDFIEALPDGYDTVVGERGESLSAGQRQRIAIARAALRSAPIAILDEPLTGLDEENARSVRDALDRLTEGRTCLLISHDLQHAASCDRIVVLSADGLAEIGTPAELLAQGGAYAQMVRASEAGVSSRREKHADET